MARTDAGQLPQDFAKVFASRCHKRAWRIRSLIGSSSKHERPTPPISKAKALGWEICSTFCSREPDRQSAPFPREDDSLQPPVADQSNCAGVGVGVGVIEADGTGEGDSPAVEKFEPMGLLLGNGVSTLMGGDRIVVTLAGAAAAAAVCAPAFVFAVLFVPARAFVPICVVPVELPLELPSPPAAPPVIPPVELLIPVWASVFIPRCPPTFVFGAIIVLLGKFVPRWAALMEWPLRPLSPAAGLPVIPPVGLLIPICVPAFIPMCAPTLGFAMVFVPVRKFGWAALLELPTMPLSPAVAPMGAPV